MKSLFDQIYEIVKIIPKGKVTTYGEIAKIIGLRDIRKVGYALHANKSDKVPCHRVVNKEGKLAKNFAFDGPWEQRRRLEGEGVGFIDDMTVDLERYLYEWS